MKRNYILLSTIALTLAGCVSVPIPPGGANAGSLGTLNINVSFTPKNGPTWGSSSFGVPNPKTENDK